MPSARAAAVDLTPLPIVALFSESLALVALALPGPLLSSSQQHTRPQQSPTEPFNVTVAEHEAIVEPDRVAEDLVRKPVPPIQGCGAARALLLLQPSDPTGCLLNLTMPST
jgi:hypothetical protein